MTMPKPALKRFLGFPLEKVDFVDMWNNTGDLSGLTIFLNKFSEESWAITINKGNASLTGVGSTEKAARAHLIRKMKEFEELVRYLRE
jgi:hypothetical protein